MTLTHEAGEMKLVVQDQGPGFTPARPERRASGLGLVCGLARQLGGTFTVEAEKGARCIVKFPGQHLP